MIDQPEYAEELAYDFGAARINGETEAEHYSSLKNEQTRRENLERAEIEKLKNLLQDNREDYVDTYIELLGDVLGRLNKDRTDQCAEWEECIETNKKLIAEGIAKYGSDASEYIEYLENRITTLSAEKEAFISQEFISYVESLRASA